MSSGSLRKQLFLFILFSEFKLNHFKLFTLPNYQLVLNPSNIDILDIKIYLLLNYIPTLTYAVISLKNYCRVFFCYVFVFKNIVRKIITFFLSVLNFIFVLNNEK